MTTRIIFDQAAMDLLFRSEDGPTGKYLLGLAIQVENRAKQLAPVDTGRLRSSINHTMGRDDRGLVATVGSDVEYAPYQEYGTWKMAAHPYLRPALEAVTGISVGDIGG